MFDERGMKTNVAVEKINPSILIHVHKKDQDNVDEDKRDDLCHMGIEIFVFASEAVSFCKLQQIITTVTLFDFGKYLFLLLV